MSQPIVKNKVGVLLERDQQLLLIKEKSESGEYLWNIIKGTFEPENDINYSEAAMRECKEEVGVIAKITHVLSFMYLSEHTKEKYVNQFNFIASIESGEPVLAAQNTQEGRNEDICEFKWFNKDELTQLGQEYFFSERTFLATRLWLTGARYDLNILQFIEGH